MIKMSRRAPVGALTGNAAGLAGSGSISTRAEAAAPLTALLAATQYRIRRGDFKGTMIRDGRLWHLAGVRTCLP